MEIINYFDVDDKIFWKEEIGKSDWGAGQYLYRLLGQFTRNYTQTTKRGLLTTNKG